MIKTDIIKTSKIYTYKSSSGKTKFNPTIIAVATTKFTKIWLRNSFIFSGP